MIASVNGEVLSAGAGWVVVGAGAGLGLRVEVPARLSRAHPGSQLALHTQLVVREDSMTLFGFETREELEVFGVLLGVSGVGPRSALGVLSELTPSQIATAVVNEDEKPFRKVSGIGPKTAKLISVQLAGKIDPQAFGGAAGDAEDEGTHGSEHSGRTSATVIAGLTGLGYSEADAVEAVRAALESGAPADEAALLRASLALLQAPRLGARSSSPSGAGR